MTQQWASRLARAYVFLTGWIPRRNLYSRVRLERMRAGLRAIDSERSNKMGSDMSSWKTTSTAIATAVFGFVLFSPETFAAWPWLVALSKFAFCGGLATFGVMAKDFNVSGKPK